MDSPAPGTAEAPGTRQSTVFACLAVTAVLGVTVALSVWSGGDPSEVHNRALQFDDAARSDATNLGHDLALFFVDYRDEPVSVSVEGDAYVISSAVAEWSVARTPGVDLGGFVSSDEDWCVWVVAPEGDVKNIHYTPEQRASDGQCILEPLTATPPDQEDHP